MVDNLEKYKKAKHFKDGEAVGGGRWAGKKVIIRKPHYDTILEWQKRSGLPKAVFFRKALLMGAVLLARQFEIAENLPELDD